VSNYPRDARRYAPRRERRSREQAVPRARISHSATAKARPTGGRPRCERGATRPVSEPAEGFHRTTVNAVATSATAVAVTAPTRIA